MWPLATYSWAIVAKNQTNEAMGEAVVKYLDWETHYGQSALAKAEGYVPLPAAIEAYARAAAGDRHLRRRQYCLHKTS